MDVERPTMAWLLFRREGHAVCGQRFSPRMREKHRAVKRSARDDDGEVSPTVRRKSLSGVPCVLFSEKAHSALSTVQGLKRSRYAKL